MKNWDGTNINLKLKIDAEEYKRIAMAYLSDRFDLESDWEKDEIVVYESCYHNDTCRRVVGKVTEQHKSAKKVYEFLKKGK